MYAIVKTGGKQYRVEPGSRLMVEKLPRAVGDTVTLNEVLLVSDGDRTTIGQPTVAGASVNAQVIQQTRGPKIVVFKKRSKKGYKKTQGHRQSLTELHVTDVVRGQTPVD